MIGRFCLALIGATGQPLRRRQPTLITAYSAPGRPLRTRSARIHLFDQVVWSGGGKRAWQPRHRRTAVNCSAVPRYSFTLPLGPLGGSETSLRVSGEGVASFRGGKCRGASTNSASALPSLRSTLPGGQREGKAVTWHGRTIDCRSSVSRLPRAFTTTGPHDLIKQMNAC